MRRTILTSLVAALAFGVGLAALADAQAPPPWKQGQPASMANSPLAPIPQPPAPKAPGEIPVDKIKLPPGFKASLWAHGLNNARAMTWGDKGTLFVSSRTAGNLYAVVDKGGQREVKTLAKGLNLPNGIAFKDGILYVAEIHRITKMVGIEDQLDNPPAMEVVYDTLPKDVPHG
jgi:glucose/arabinose dehydrogenase